MPNSDFSVSVFLKYNTSDVINRHEFRWIISNYPSCEIIITDGSKSSSLCTPISMGYLQLPVTNSLLLPIPEASFHDMYSRSPLAADILCSIHGF